MTQPAKTAIFPPSSSSPLATKNLKNLIDVFRIVKWGWQLKNKKNKLDNYAAVNSLLPDKGKIPHFQFQEFTCAFFLVVVKYNKELLTEIWQIDNVRNGV